MEREIIKKIIKEYNVWWIEEFEYKEYKDRYIYQKIKDFLKHRQIIALTGLRRVGKTSLILKIIENKLKEGFKKDRIFYFSFDEFYDIRIREIIEIYEELTMNNLKDGEFIFLFDEIQKVSDWQEQIKRLYDVYPKIKFIISGSESLFIKKKSKENLGGRIFEFKVNPLSFKEYLSFIGRKYNSLELNIDKIKKDFFGYLFTNGFPETIDKDRKFILKYLKENVIEKIIESDMPKVFGIKNIDDVRTIFNIIYNDPGEIIDIQDLSREIGIDRNMLSNILEYLEQSYLIKKLYNFSRNARKTERKLKRYYPTIINPYLIDDNFPKVFENFVVLFFNAEFFWRDSYKNEVDIVHRKVKGKKIEITGIEVKSGKIKKEDMVSINNFKRKFDAEVEIISFVEKPKIDGVDVKTLFEEVFL